MNILLGNRELQAGKFLTNPSMVEVGEALMFYGGEVCVIDTADNNEVIDTGYLFSHEDLSREDWVVVENALPVLVAGQCFAALDDVDNRLKSIKDPRKYLSKGKEVHIMQSVRVLR